MQWDDKKGKYVKPFTKKKLLKNLIFNGISLQWDFPEPKMDEFTELEKKEFLEYLDTSLEEMVVEILLSETSECIKMFLLT